MKCPGYMGKGNYLQETDQENGAVVNGDGHGEGGLILDAS